MDMPNSGSGFLHWALLGLGASIVALLLAYLFPSIIPAKAAATQL